jgi:hypothetical protein
MIAVPACAVALGRGIVLDVGRHVVPAALETDS